MKCGYIFLVLVLLFSLGACNLPEGDVPQALESTATESAIPPTTTQISPTPADAESTVDSMEQESTENEACSTEKGSVAVIVTPEILDGIQDGLTRFEEDLRLAGYQVSEIIDEFSTPVDLRIQLADLYQSTGECLTGAYLIGDMPHAYQWFRTEYANPDIPPTEQEVISFQYYADLDGIFRASADYTSPGGHPHSFDIHEGDLDWEIWVGVLPVYYGDTGQTIQAINRYFERNHAYRQGQYTIPRNFLLIYEFQTAEDQTEHDQIEKQLATGQYAWTPFSSDPDARLYFNSPSAEMTVDQGYSALSEGVADFTVVRAHGTWQRSGSIDIDWVESNPVETVFYYSSGCSVGNLDYADNLLTSIIYSPTSKVLVAWGTTSESGGMGTNQDGSYGHNVASDLSEGKSFGEAILEHVNTPLRSPWSDHRELHYALQVFLGDPSLTLFP